MRNNYLILLALALSAPLQAQQAGGFVPVGDQAVYVASGSGASFDLSAAAMAAGLDLFTCNSLEVKVWTGRPLASWLGLPGWHLGRALIDIRSGGPVGYPRQVAVLDKAMATHPEGFVERSFTEPNLYSNPWLVLWSTSGAKGYADLRVSCDGQQFLRETWQEPAVGPNPCLYYTTPLPRIPGGCIAGLDVHAALFKPSAANFPAFGPPVTEPPSISTTATDTGDGFAALTVTLNGYLAADKCSRLGLPLTATCDEPAAFAGWCRAEDIGSAVPDQAECFDALGLSLEAWAGE